MSILSWLTRQRSQEIAAELDREENRQQRVFERAKVRQRLLELDIKERELRLMAPLEAERLANLATVAAASVFYGRRKEDVR